MGITNIQLRKGFFEMLYNEPAIIAATEAAARKIEAEAVRTAPVDTGAYRDSIAVNERVSRGGRHVFWVSASDKKALLVEARTGNLQRAGRAVSRG